MASGVKHLRRIAVPSLVVQTLGDTGVFPSDARMIHDALGAQDKRLELVPGDHYLGVRPRRAAQSRTRSQGG